ncbi:unnamed protein product [Arabis nemorensis]|uniref:Uncharacterized protein n=1 Tax=Arabis nemorensis TaxID=586526 RepID=A0A565AZD7_9BRAS|nr:unnamed protein product [Arabis nemorensis]
MALHSSVSMSPFPRHSSESLSPTSHRIRRSDQSLPHPVLYCRSSRYLARSEPVHLLVVAKLHPWIRLAR